VMTATLPCTLSMHACSQGADRSIAVQFDD
jgi:hypothetical protein